MVEEVVLRSAQSMSTWCPDCFDSSVICDPTKRYRRPLNLVCGVLSLIEGRCLGYGLDDPSLHSTFIMVSLGTFLLGVIVISRKESTSVSATKWHTRSRYSRLAIYRWVVSCWV